MNNRIAKSAVIALSLLASACGNLKLVANPGTVSIQSVGEICVEPPEQNLRLTKFLFVVDKSGSNQSGNGPGSPPTDPTCAKRCGSIQKFMDTNASNPNLRWGFMVFNGSGARAFINDGNEQSPIFTADPGQLQQALQRSQGEPDTDATPYRSALALSKTAIRNDLVKNPKDDSIYIVIMLTDGYPTDYGQPINDNAIFTDVDDLVSISPDRTFFSTAYYGPVDGSASDRLRQMAVHGRGKFTDTNTDGELKIQELIVGPSAEPWMIKRFVVYNLNAAACDDGTMDTDSDADGLCDKDEIRYNQELAQNPAMAQRMGGHKFDPYSRNSFDNVYSDSVEYKHIVFGETLPAGCTDGTDADMDLATKCEEQYFYNANPQGPTANWTQAMQKTADPDNFDSDGDGFLDMLEFMLFRDKGVALDYNSTTRIYSGMKGEDIFLQHRNWRNPTSGPGYDGNLQFTKVNDKGQNCYSYTQNVLPVYPTKGVGINQVSGFENLAHGDQENVVLVYMIQVPEKDPNGKGILKYSYQKLNYSAGAAGAAAGLDLDTSKFKTYKPAVAN